MGIKVQSKNPEKPFQIYLPGIFIFLLLLPLFMILLVPFFFLLIALIIWNLVPEQKEKAKAYTAVIFRLPEFFVALRGLCVDVDTKDVIVKIKF